MKLESFDPLRSVADYARIAARLADPFAQRDAVLRDAEVDGATADAADERWRARILADPETASLFVAAFQAERARLLGGATSLTQAREGSSAVKDASDRAAVGATGRPHSGSGGPVPMTGSDVTVIAPTNAPDLARALKGIAERAALPFKPGRFEPPPAEPRPPIVRAADDPDVTRPPVTHTGPALPFVASLPTDGLPPDRLPSDGLPSRRR